MKKFIVVIFFFSFTLNGFAWGVTGHRASGLIAEQYLNAKAKKKINQLLKGESLAMAGNWMDEIKSDSAYDYMNDWHWVTIETGQTYDQSRKNAKGDVIMTLEKIIAELQTHKLDPKKEVEYIKILLHLVGDIHQPFHVGCCDDQGGNKVKVKWFKNESNLHKVWDSEMIDETRLSYTELVQALGKPDKDTVAAWQKNSVRDWAVESMSYRKQAYAIGDGNLGYKYSYKNLGTAKEQILKAGVRLANILNQIYGK